MRRLSLLAVLIGLVPFGSAMATGIQVEWVTRYGTDETHGEEIKTILSGIPDTYVRMWRNISNSALRYHPPELLGATYLQRRTNWNLNPQYEGIGELFTDWLGENRVRVAEECTVVVGIRGDTPAQRSTLISEGWFDLHETMGIQNYNNPDPLGDRFDLFARNIPAGIVSVPTAAIPLHASDDSLHIVFMFQARDQFPQVPEPSTLVLLCIVDPKNRTTTLSRIPGKIGPVFGRKTWE